MKNAKYLLMAILAMGVSSAMAQVSFEGNEKPVYVEGKSSNTGDMAVYVLYSAQGVSMLYTASIDPDNVSWQEIVINDLGERVYNDIEVAHNGNVTSLAQVKTDQGYIIKEGDKFIPLRDYDYTPENAIDVETKKPAELEKADEKEETKAESSAPADFDDAAVNAAFDAQAENYDNGEIPGSDVF